MDQSITIDQIPKVPELEEESIDEVCREAEEERIEEDGPELEKMTDDESLPTVTEDHSHGSRSCLCAHCDSIFDHWLQDSVRIAIQHKFPHYKEYQELQKSAADGCALCLQFTWSIDVIVFQELENGMQQLEYKVILDDSGACRFNAIDGYCLYMGFRLSITSDVQVRAVNSDSHKHFNAWIYLIPDSCAGRVGEKVAWQRDGSHANIPVGLKDSDR